ncbi:MAG: hypothetical protein REJ23_07445 [Brevundimonas sp.]|nr:hypothetical protein [Brevundimonas sp.]
MQALIDLIAGLIAMLAAAALSQFGLDLDAPRKPDREIHRVRDCAPPSSSTVMIASPEKTREC